LLEGIVRPFVEYDVVRETALLLFEANIDVAWR
jgi:hypothetical protein